MFRGQIEQVIESSPMSNAPAMKCARVRYDADAPSSVSRTGLETQKELPHPNTELNNPMPRFYDETKRQAPELGTEAKCQTLRNEGAFLSRLLCFRRGTLYVPHLPGAIPGVRFIPKIEYESYMKTMHINEQEAAHTRTIQAQKADNARTTYGSPLRIDPRGMAESRTHGDRLDADCPTDYMAASHSAKLRDYRSRIRQALSKFLNGMKPLQVVVESSNEVYMVLLEEAAARLQSQARQARLAMVRASTQVKTE